MERSLLQGPVKLHYVRLFTTRWPGGLLGQSPRGPQGCPGGTCARWAEASQQTDPPRLCHHTSPPGASPQSCTSRSDESCHPCWFSPSARVSVASPYHGNILPPTSPAKLSSDAFRGSSRMSMTKVTRSKICMMASHGPRKRRSTSRKQSR